MNAPRESSLSKELAAFRRRWRAGLFVRGLLWLATIFTGVVILYALVDRWFALAPGTRWILHAGVGSVLVLLAGTGLWRLRRYTLKTAADQADDSLTNTRREIGAGFELLQEHRDGSAMHVFLTRRAIDAASDQLAKAPGNVKLPKAAIRRQSWWLSGCLALALVLAMINLGATTRILARLWNPSADWPPYSKWRFAVTPENPAVIYGDDLLLQSEITGGELREDAVFLVKDLRSGAVERRTCYREQGQRYAQRLENVVRPVAIAFAVGKARSHWHEVAVRMQPRVTEAQLTITFPPYASQGVVSFPLGEGECKALTGSKLQVALTSNRPLRDGTLTITPKQALAGQAPRVIKAAVTDTHTARFDWTLAQSATLQFMLEDLLGTALAQPLELDQLAIPDAPPVAHITSLEPLILATPKSEIPFEAEIDDDLGLAKTSWIRSLSGYRDRPRLLAKGELGKHYAMSEPLHLEPLGARPGQTLEFVVEGTDENPTLMGIGTSDPVQVQVISEDEYAELIRLRTTLDEFIARYDALAEALEKARQGLSELETSDNPKDALKDAMKAHENAAEIFDKVAKDFQAFFSEASLAEMAHDTAQLLRQQSQELGQLILADPGKIREAARAMREALGGAEEAMQREMAKADELESLGRVMEMAARFQKIVADQLSVTKRKEAIAREVMRGIMTNVPQLKALARVQRENEKAVEDFIKELRARADALPPQYEVLRGYALQFADTMEALDVAPAMNMAAQQADAGNSREAASNARLAYRLLQRLLNERSRAQCGFAGICQGGVPKFGIPQDMIGTMKQLLEAMLGRNGAPGSGAQAGQSWGSGGIGIGLAGSGSDGSYMPGYHQLRLPMFGPARLRFQSQASRMSGRSGRGAGGRAGNSGAAAMETLRDTMEATRGQEGGQADLQSVPERYRDAVKRYFSEPFSSTDD